MKNHTTADNEHSTSHSDAHSLIAATVDAAEEKVTEAKNRLADAMESAKETYSRLQKKAVQGAKATDKAIRSKPYQAMGIAFGVGALVGYLLSRRNRE